MSLFRRGLASLPSSTGSIFLPEKQEQRIDAMRRDTLERLDATANKVSTSVVAGAIVTALSTAVLVRNAYKMRRGV